MKMTKIAKEVLYKNDFFAKRYDKTCGAVYIAKYGNGLIKIGSTSSPRERYKQLAYNAPEYAGAKIEEFAITNPLEEYQDLEKALHRRFWKWNVGKEIFNVDIQEAVQVVNKEFNKFDYPKASGFKPMAVPAVMKIFKSGRIPNDEEQRKLAIMAFEDGMRAYDIFYN